ncbi:hypothetical protein F5Y16DRAFT_394875 [Xylariaceae sp. FL0255]|nr:hypothetical protein F5Y16DRAFT_394875 [Xylariaceae sp. FL0255]
MDPATFLKALLHSSSSSLRSIQMRLDVAKFGLLDSMRFTALKSLRLTSETFQVTDERSFSSFIGDSLTSLVVPYGFESELDLLSEVGFIPSLETLVLFSYWRECVDGSPRIPSKVWKKIVGFIELNPQITTLVLENGYTRESLLSIIAATRYHDNLKKLSFGVSHKIFWQPLSELCCLSQVEVLRITCIYYDDGWSTYHDKLAISVTPLAKIRRLIFEGEIYHFPDRYNQMNHRDADAYYARFKPGTIDWAFHEAKMSSFASNYIRALPKLEFILIGRIIFKVQENRGVREPVLDRRL